MKIEFGFRTGVDRDHQSTAEVQLEVDVLCAVSPSPEIADHEAMLFVLGKAPAKLDVRFDAEFIDIQIVLEVHADRAAARFRHLEIGVVERKDCSEFDIYGLLEPGFGLGVSN